MATGIVPVADEHDQKIAGNFQSDRRIPNYDWTLDLPGPTKIEGIVWNEVFYPFPWTLPAEPVD